MIEDIYQETRENMGKSIEDLNREFKKVRTGRASLSILDGIRVNYYGTPTPLNQMATLAVPESRLITIQPWDVSGIKEIEKAILKSDLGLTPSSDGKIVRIAIPPLTEERRKELVRVINKMSEEHKVAVRNIRRDANEMLKELKKEGDISEDEAFKAQDQVQKITDDHINLVEQALLWLAFSFYIKKRLVPFCVFVLFAASFKMTPTFFIILVLLSDDKNKYKLFVGSAGAFLTYLLIQYVILPDYFTGFVRNALAVVGESGRVVPSTLKFLGDIFKICPYIAIFSEHLVRSFNNIVFFRNGTIIVYSIFGNHIEPSVNQFLCLLNVTIIDQTFPCHHLVWRPSIGIIPLSCRALC